ncbi:hypothetical protein BDW68DRAFT_173301 [Aspergillus falconensis]
MPILPQPCYVYDTRGLECVFGDLNARSFGPAYYGSKEGFPESVGSGIGQSIDGCFVQTLIHFALPAGKRNYVDLAQGFHRPKPFANSTVPALLTFYLDGPRHGRP